MTDAPRQPKNSDAVLGGFQTLLVSAAVLGGLEGVKHRFSSPIEQHKILALNDALNYGNCGLDLIISALGCDSIKVKKAAFLTLCTVQDQIAKLAISNFNFFGLLTCQQTINAHSGFVNSLAALPTSNCFVSSSGDKLIKLWELDTGNFIGQSLGFTYAISSDALPENIVLASGCYYNSGVKTWNIKTQKAISLSRLATNCNRAIGVCKNFESHIYLTGINVFGKLAVWDLNSKDHYKPFHVFKNSFASAIAANGRLVINVDFDQSIDLWETKTGKHLGNPFESFPYSFNCVSAIALSPDGSIATLGTKTGLIVVNSFGVLDLNLRSITALEISRNNRVLVAGDSTGKIIILDLKTQEYRFLEGHKNLISSICILCDGKSVITGDQSGIIKIWGIK
jgi:WD40 repeat protein